MKREVSILEDIRPAYPKSIPCDLVRTKLFELLGLGPTPAPVDFTVEMTEHTDDGLIVTRVSYRNSFGETVPGIIITPAGSQGEPLPGIVCMPGTSGSAERVAHQRFYCDKPDTGPLIGWGRELARRGFATLSITLMGCEVRRRTDQQWDEQAKLLAPYGLSQMGLHVDEALRGARVLAGLEYVDPERIALAGMSLGGNAAWYAMACAPWINTAVPICGGIGSLATVIHEGDPKRHSSHFYIPHMLRYFDHSEIVAACIAPRPFMVIAPTMDEDMPRSGVDKLVRSIRPIYESAGRKDHFKVFQPETKHVFLQEYFEWMVEWFRQFVGKGETDK